MMLFTYLMDLFMWHEFQMDTKCTYTIIAMQTIPKSLEISAKKGKQPSKNIRSRVFFLFKVSRLHIFRLKNNMHASTTIETRTIPKSLSFVKRVNSRVKNLWNHARHARQNKTFSNKVQMICNFVTVLSYILFCFGLVNSTCRVEKSGLGFRK